MPEGRYYIADLIGLSVMTEDGVFGTISDVFQTGANDVYVIRRDAGEEELVPDIPQFIRNIDITAHRIQIDFPEWL